MDKIDDIILKNLQQGKTKKIISEEIGLSLSYVQYKVKKMKEQGIEVPVVEKAGRPKKTQNDEIDKKILEGILEGKTQTKIAEEVGLSCPTVSRRIDGMRDRGEIAVEFEKTGRIKKTQNNEINAKILEGLKKGKTQTELSKDLGLTKQGISQRIDRMREKGVEVPSASKIRNEELNKTILRGLEEGKNKKDIAEEIGLSYTTVKYKVKQMRDQGIENPVLERSERNKKTQNDEIDNKILEELSKGKKRIRIAEEMGVTHVAIYNRIKRMEKRGVEIPIYKENDNIRNKKIAKMIGNLIETKHATIEQIKIIADEYGIDIKEVLKSLDEQER